MLNISFTLISFSSYVNCALAKYMEKHKIRHDTKEFALVSFKIKFNQAVFYDFHDF
jgi:hypothetical protein